MLNRALGICPQVSELFLSSRGGSVLSALTMAYTVREAGLRTVIPKGADCFSACSYLFFAGAAHLYGGQRVGADPVHRHRPLRL